MLRSEVAENLSSSLLKQHLKMVVCGRVSSRHKTVSLVIQCPGTFKYSVVSLVMVSSSG